MGTHRYNFLNNLLVIYERVFIHWLQAKYERLNEMLYVFDIYAKHYVLSEQYDMPDGLNYEYTHTQMSYILYFFKMSKLPTL
jgi:hypothetical protein